MVLMVSYLVMCGVTCGIQCFYHVHGKAESISIMMSIVKFLVFLIQKTLFFCFTDSP